MSGRVQLGWHVPREIWDRFETHVHGIHGRCGPHAQTHLELAMAEYLDDDEILAEAEALLSAHTDLHGLSSSTAAAGIGTTRYQSDTTKKVMHRVDADLRDRFRAFAKKHDTRSYGRLLAAALDTYTRGGRARRILDDVERLVTGDDRETTTADTPPADAGEDAPASAPADPDQQSLSSVGGCGTTTGTTTASPDPDPDPGHDPDPADDQDPDQPPDSLTVEPRLVLEIADTLPDDAVPKRVLREAVLEAVDPPDGQADGAVEAYRDPVLEQLLASEHPHNENLYVTDAWRDANLLYADMDKAMRITFLRRYAAAALIERERRADGFTYTEVQDLFKFHAGGGAPSHQYAYDLMEAAADEPGFKYGEFHGTIQLRVDLTAVSDSVLEWALDEQDVRVEELPFDARLSSFAASAPPQQEAADDDD